MGQTILTPVQEKAIAVVAGEPHLAHFYLSGGTALAAYYLHHRISDDLDFFSAHAPEMIFLHSFAERLKEIVGATQVRFERLYERNQFFFLLPDSELKIEFTRYPFPQFEIPQEISGLKID